MNGSNNTHKSTLDLLVEKRVFIEKYSVASKIIDAYTNAQPGRFHLAIELDSNKFSMISYQNDTHIDLYVAVILKNVYLNRSLPEHMQSFIKKNMEQKIWPNGFNPLLIDEEAVNNCTLFLYKATVGGAAVLSSVLNNELGNVLRLEALKLEKVLLDYGR